MSSADRLETIAQQLEARAGISSPLSLRRDTTAEGKLRRIADALAALSTVEEAPADGKRYVRQNGNWVEGAEGSATAVWGAITGTLADQTDLQAALDGKAETSHTHTEADITDLGPYAAASHSHTLADVTDSGELAAIDDAPSDGTGYVRKNGAWAAESGGGGGGNVASNIAMYASTGDTNVSTATTNICTLDIPAGSLSSTGDMLIAEVMFGQRSGAGGLEWAWYLNGTKLGNDSFPITPDNDFDVARCKMGLRYTGASTAYLWLYWHGENTTGGDGYHGYPQTGLDWTATQTLSFGKLFGTADGSAYAMEAKVVT